MRPRVCFVGMGEVGHLKRLQPLIVGLAERGAEVHVLTDSRFGREVERAGARFVDMLDRHPLSEADDESIPIPCRFVTYAGRFADEVTAELAELAPDVILYDTFAVVGHVAARALGIPHVNVCAGHDRVPSRFLAECADDPPPQISPACEEAVGILRERFGLESASPFSFVDGFSPHLNIYCEPPEFLPDADRATFEPLAFFGSLQPDQPPPQGATPWPAPERGGARVYASFGTVVWRYWPEHALATLRSVAEAVGADPSAQAVISLGGVRLEAGETEGLERPNVAVRDYVDQWAVLGEADVFVTHNGLNSTHEAIYQRVPMVSHPFFTDQPALAEHCLALDLAVPLADGLRGEVSAGLVRTALETVAAERPRLERGLARAREWELATIAGREAVLDRILALAAPANEAARAG